jgi:hypothetical protein
MAHDDDVLGITILQILFNLCGPPKGEFVRVVLVFPLRHAKRKVEIKISPHHAVPRDALVADGVVCFSQIGSNDERHG